MRIECTASHLQTTILHLQEGGRFNRETMVLWLASKDSSGLQVAQVHKPDQFAARDVFRIPPEAMRALMKHLRSERLRIVAQVHSHPEEAFHSLADDAWAIVRHEGALSIVLPHFARDVTPANFFEMAATYALSSLDTWDRVERRDLSRHVVVL